MSPVMYTHHHITDVKCLVKILFIILYSVRFTKKLDNLVYNNKTEMDKDIRIDSGRNDPDSCVKGGEVKCQF
jgi:hypothetical protein